MPQEIEKIIISNEDEAWANLKLALANEISDTAIIEFDGWPVFNLKIQGTDFHGTIPTRIMPPILDMQKEIHRIYARAKYNSDNTNRLTAKDREMLELVVTVNEGCSEYLTELFAPLNEIIKSSGMNGTEAVILLVSISAVMATGLGWKRWLEHKEKLHAQDASSSQEERLSEERLAYSEQETKRLELMSIAANREPRVAAAYEAMDDIKDSFSKKLKATDNLNINGNSLINGSRAAQIVPKPKERSVEIRLDGEFSIKEVKFPKAFGEAYRFSVVRVIDKKAIIVEASPEVITREQVKILKDGAFGIKTVVMQINAKQINDNISSASLVSIAWPPSPPSE